MTDSKTIDDYLELAAQHVERNGLAVGQFVLVEEGKEITECRACMDGAYAIVRGAVTTYVDTMPELALKDRYGIADAGWEAEGRIADAIRRDPSPAPREEIDGLSGSSMDSSTIFRFSDWCAANLPDAEARAAVAAKLRAS